MIPRACILGLALLAATAATGEDRLRFPTAARRPVVDTYFEVKVRDDYQWLEDTTNRRVLSWAKKQDDRARRWLERLPEHPAITQQLQMWYRRSSAHHLELADTATGLIALISDPGHQHNYLARLAVLDDPASATILVDPTVVDPTSATAIDWWVPSPSGRRLAVCLSQHGSEVGTLHFFDGVDGTPLPDRIPRVQFPTGGGSAVWTSDESGVFYTRYPAPGERPEPDLKFYQQVYFHRLGTDPAQDTYAIGRDFPRIAEIELSATPDGLFTLASVSDGDGGDYAFFLLPEGGTWEQIATFTDGLKHVVLADDGHLYALTHHEAPRGRIVRMPLAHPDLDSAVDVVSQNDGVIRDFAVHDEGIYVREIVGGPSRLRLHARTGTVTLTVPLPAESSVTALVPRANGTLLLRLARYVKPPAWYEFNPRHTGLRETALASTAPVTFTDVRVERVTAAAPDGVQIPITLLVPKTVIPGTPAPLLLQGYGAYGAVNEPDFAAHRRLWFDAGGVIAIAHVRGSGDFGADWHKAGNLAKKQTTFSDFIACAQHLIARKWTQPERLAIQGGSAGGLLMGAVLTQHPELFRVVVSRVGIYDALRSERSANGEYNTTEFGTVKIREQFDALRAYSPYHRVAAGTEYPAVLFTTGLHDGRVLPSHSFKMTARLQHATASRHPVLLRVDFDSGHGRGSTRSAQSDERADIYAFLFSQLGMKVGANPDAESERGRGAPPPARSR